MPDTAVQEAREWVRAAVRNSGLVFPPHTTAVNLRELIAAPRGRLTGVGHCPMIMAASPRAWACRAHPWR